MSSTVISNFDTSCVIEMKAIRTTFQFRQQIQYCYNTLQSSRLLRFTSAVRQTDSNNRRHRHPQHNNHSLTGNHVGE